MTNTQKRVRQSMHFVIGIVGSADFIPITNSGVLLQAPQKMLEMIALIALIE